MNVLMGVLDPTSGEGLSIESIESIELMIFYFGFRLVIINRKLKCGLFRQHFVDQLNMEVLFD